MNANIRRNWFLQGIASVGDCGLFFVAVLGALPKSLRYWRETCRQVWFVGAMSLVIVMTCGLFVGMVLALQLYYTLSIFGATSALGTVVALSLFRELGPVVTALLVAGRAGTAVTAEIGLMRATDQIDAMGMMAVDPLAYIAAPRFLAGVIAMPLLACVFNAMGSRPTNGSSYRINMGSNTIARASATRRAMPPESSAGINCAAPRKPTACNLVSTMLRSNSSGSRACWRNGNATFSNTLKSVSSAEFWNRKPMRSRKPNNARRESFGTSSPSTTRLPASGRS